MSSQSTTTNTNSWDSTTPQTTWDTITDPDLEALSRAAFGIPAPGTTPVRTQSSYEWCMERKEQILAGHSSKTSTPAFTLQCFGCERFFKHCMFSIAERKAENKSCRWCQAEGDENYDRKQWAVHRHIYCNRLGAKRCR